MECHKTDIPAAENVIFVENHGPTGKLGKYAKLRQKNNNERQGLLQNAHRLQ